MIRKATLADAEAIKALVRGQHMRSTYARYRISEPALDHVVNSMIAQQGQIGPQGSCVFVAEHDGKPVGFIAGILDRVYGIGSKLCAQDLFFVSDGGLGDAVRLVDAYIAWGRAIRAVLEIKLSSNAAMHGSEHVAKLFQRKGMKLAGEVFEIRTDVATMGEAA